MLGGQITTLLPNLKPKTQDPKLNTQRFLSVIHNPPMALMPLLALCVVRGQTGATPPVRISDAEVTATDALNRTLPGYREVGPPKPGRWVGMFFWFWHGDDRFGKDYNVTEFMKTHPGFLDFTAKPNNPTFYWGEPIFGYYRSMDPWVMRRQLALISHAGVDFLFLDYTNAILYDKELSMFLNVAEDLKRHGAQVPKLVFFLNANPDPMVESLYTNWYKPGKYDEHVVRVGREAAHHEPGTGEREAIS